MDTLVSMRIFREIVERGGFASAAKQLGFSTAMASKHVAHLERRVGARLLNRTSRQQSLTEAGELYYAQCCEALDIIETADAAIGQSTATPRGTLKVSAPVWCASGHFVAALAEYRRRYPDVVVDLRLENAKVDLVHEGFDVALRATEAPSPTLIARPICPVDFQLVATPDFAERHGWPATAADVSQCPAVLPTYTRREVVTMRDTDGEIVLRLQAALKTDDTTLAQQAVLAGMGIAFLPEWLVAPDLAAGRLVRLLPAYAVAPVMLYAVYTSRKYLAPKVRSFIDHFSAALTTQGKAEA